MKTNELPILSDKELLGTVGHLNNLLQHNPELFAGLFREMLHNPNSRVRLRAGNAIEKAARKNPELLEPYQSEILEISPKTQETEIIWHLALLLGYLNLQEDDLALAVNLLYKWLDSIPHKFAKINCLQTLAILAKKHDWLKPEVIETLQAAANHESPAIKARTRKLLNLLQPAGPTRKATGKLSGKNPEYSI